MTRYLDKITDEIKITKALTYAVLPGYDAEHTETPLMLDVYEPAGDMETNRHAILFVHGGGFVSGTRDVGYPPVICTLLAKRGYVCFSIDYRLFPSGKERGTYADAAPIAAKDVDLARKWIFERAEEFGFDPAKMAISGGSAGGMACIEACKLHNYSAFACLWGTNDGATLCEGFPPTILIHGTADQLVAYEYCEAFYAKLKENNVTCQLVTLPDAPHTPMKRLADFEGPMVEFLYKNM